MFYLVPKVLILFLKFPWLRKIGWGRDRVILGSSDRGITKKKHILLVMRMERRIRINNVKTRTAMNAKMSVFVICVEVIIYLLYDLHDCTFKGHHVVDQTGKLNSLDDNEVSKVYVHLC